MKNTDFFSRNKRFDNERNITKNQKKCDKGSEDETKRC